MWMSTEYPYAGSPLHVNTEFDDFQFKFATSVIGIGGQYNLVDMHENIWPKNLSRYTV